MRSLRLTLLFALILCAPSFVAHAQMNVPDTEEFLLARVVSAGESSIDIIVGTDLTHASQTLTVEVLEGDRRGEHITFVNDFTQLHTGDRFYLKHLVSPSEGTEYYTVADPYRLPVLGILTVGFLLILFLFGGLQGVRGLASLFGSLVLISYLLLPGIHAGYPPVAVAVAIASLIIVLGSYVTHGFNRTTSAAVLGMIVTVVVTGAVAWYAVGHAALSGFSSDEVATLNFAYHGSLDLVGILLSGIIIGLLGVLYDSAIGQAVAVEELMRAGTHLSPRQVFARAMRIGREHIGALVNTLAIAYVGAALPLLLLVGSSTAPLGYILNSEVFSTEIIRILIGSIGLVLAVPVTTGIAVGMLHTRRVRVGEVNPS